VARRSTRPGLGPARSPEYQLTRQRPDYTRRSTPTWSVAVPHRVHRGELKLQLVHDNRGQVRQRRQLFGRRLARFGVHDGNGAQMVPIGGDDRGRCVELQRT